MAATRLIPLHVNKGQTIQRTLSRKTDCSKNPEKTEDGKYVRTNACDPKMVNKQFLLSEAQYERAAGRHHKRDVIAHQICQFLKSGGDTRENKRK